MSTNFHPLSTAPTFASLPADVLRYIAEEADELTIWRLMATCRLVRHAVEPALKPYLTRPVITVDPPFVTDSKYMTSRAQHNRSFRC